VQEFQYIQDILKDFYTPVVVNQMYKKSPVWAIIKKKTANMDGKRVVIPVRIGFTEAVGARAQNNYNLPGAQRNTYDQTYLTMKRVYGRVMVDGFAIESAKGKGGWIDVLQGEIQGSLDAFALNMDRMLELRGTGKMATVDGAIAGQVITVKDPGGVVGDTPETKWFRKGMVLDIYSTGGAKHADSVQVSIVDPANQQITVTGDISSVVSTDYIFKEDTYEGANSNGEFMGLDGIVGADNPIGNDFQGIDATAEPTWRSYVKTSAGALSEDLIQQALDAIDDQTDGDPVDLALTTKTIRNKLITLQKTAYQTQSLNLTAGWKAIKYVGGEVELPFLAAKNAVAGQILYLARPHLKLYVLKALTWDDKLGGVIKGVSGMDAYEAWFKIYANLGVDCRNPFGKQTGVTIT